MAMLLLAGCGWLIAAGAYHEGFGEVRLKPDATYCRALVLDFLVFFRHAIAALKGERNFVDDDVRARVAKNQMPADEAVLDIAGQIGQRQQDIRRHRGKRSPLR